MKLFVLIVVCCIAGVYSQPLCALANNPQQLAILQDVPVLYYQLNDFEHPAVRNYGPLATVLDGTFQGTPTLNVAGVHPEPNLRDAAVAFNRAAPGQGITRAAHPALQSTSFSVEAWAFPDGVAGSQTIYNNLNANTGYALFFQGNLWVCRIGTGAGTVDVTASEYQNEADLWTHAVCIYNSTTSTATLYVDGRVQNTVNTAYSPSTGGVTIATGALGDFVGILDEIAVFDFPLTHEDVRDHWGYVFVYASLTENFRPFAYYRMEEPLLETVLENDGIGGPALNLNSLGIPTSGFPTGLFAALPGQNIANSNRGLAGTPLNIAGTYGTTGNQPFFQSPSFTFVGWIDPINGGAFASNLVDTGNILSPVTQGFRISYSLLPALTFTVQIGTGGAATILSSNNAPLGFNHVAVTYNATSRELKYFLNGAVAAQTTTTYLPNTIPGSQTFIGGDGTVAGGFTGTLDEIAFMDYVLTEQEVASLVGGGVETCNDASFITCPANEVCVSYGPRCAVCVGITSQIINNVDVGTPYTIDRNRVYDWDVVHTNLVPAQDVLSYAVPGQANTLGSRYFVDEYTPDLPIDLLTVPGGVNNLRVAAFLKRAPGQWYEFAVQLNLSNDFDGDGILDAVDRDIDNDGILNTDEPGDTDGDGFPDQMDLDSDNDGIPDIIEIGGQDTNGDGFVDNFTDGNGDGFHDPFETIPLLQVDTDNDGHFDGVDLDSDNDGIPDIVETGLGFLDTNYDGLIDTILDPNRDGMHDTVSVTSPVRDTDVDGVPDFLDLDSDNDGVPDVVETGIANTIQLPGRLIGITDANSDGFDDNLVGRINPDTDNDGFPDYLDLDSDNDGMSDTIEVSLGAFDGDNNGVLVSFTDANGDGWDDNVSAATTPVPNFDSDAFEDFRDIDSDNDGIIDSAENLLFNIPTTDANGNGFYDAAEGSTVFNHDGDSLPNYLDLDSDWDDIPDVIEAGGNDANGDGFIDGFVDVGPADGLHDGLPLGGLFQDTDGDGAPDHLDLDSDNDTIFDVVEGVSIDGDRNGIADVPGAATTFDANYPDTDSDGQEDFRDLDSDNDAIGDISEAQMFVQSLVDSDVDGVADLPDTDGDGIPNVVDDSASWGTLSGYPIPLDSDSDGNPDHLEIDSNNDSITDLFVAFGTAGSVFDMNGDGVVDDPTDTDRDGIADVVDTKATFGGLSATKDTDRDTIPDIFDGDADNDGILNVDEPAGDNDGDGIPNYLDSDSDNDGIPDTIESGQTDSNYDGYVDGFVDLDSDGVHDPLQINPIVPVDLDSDTVPDFVDIDSDNDGLPDVQETSFTGAPINLGQITILPGDDTNVNGWSDLAEARRTGRDRDSDARQDHLDRDSDNDGISDAHELGHPDATNDGVVDGFVDTNSNGWHDALEFNFVPRNTDGDSVPDYWDLDSDNDGISDVQESGASDFGGDFLTDFFIDVNRDGISDRAINRAIPDTDSDGVHDYRDLDSDNDSLSDLFESFVFANLAPVDSNDNGVLDNIDTDGDGIADAIDQTTNRGNSNQFVSSNNWRRVDSDGDGTPDMIEFRNDIDFTVVDPDGNGIVVGVDVDADGIVDIIDDNTSAFGFLRAPVFILPSPSATSVPSVTRSPVAPSSSRSPIPSASFVPSVVPSSPPSSPPSIPVPSPGASSSSQASASSAASSTASSAASSAASRSAPSTSSAPTASRTSTHTREPVPIPVSSAVPSPIVVDSLNPNSVEIVVELACRNGLSCTQEEVSEFIITIGVLINDPDAVTIVSLDGTVLTFVVCDNSFILELVAELSTSTPQPRFAIFSTADVLSVVYDVPCVDYYYFIESVSAQTVLAASLLGAFTMAMLI